MLAIRLPRHIEKRLERLVARTGRTKTYYAREAILQHLDELEDPIRAEVLRSVHNPSGLSDEAVQALARLEQPCSFAADTASATAINRARRSSRSSGGNNPGMSFAAAPATGL